MSGTVPATAAAVIDIRNVSKVYHPGTEAEVRALDGVSMQIHRGEFVAIMGPSGSGKSTLMNLIGCLDSPSSGSYRCGGVDVATLSAAERAHLRRDQIGFVFQSFHLLPRQTALKNVMMPMTYTGIPRREREPRARAALELVGLGSRLSHKPSELSGGQQQRVAIARALVNKPPVLLADEPTGALDSRTSEEIMALLKQLQADGQTIVLITHDAAVAAHADRCVRMRDGRIETGSPT
jgi:putative ABC transport system ATP-binding protein